MVFSRYSDLFPSGFTFRCPNSRANFLLVTSYYLLGSSHQLLVTSRQLLVTSYQSLVTSHQSLVAIHQLLVTSCQSLVTSSQLLVTSYQLLITSYWSPVFSKVTLYQLPQITCNMEFIKHKNFFPGHVFLNAFAVTYGNK